ncbi:hypothetical protein GGR52DRAFT_387547 [Hypoxylon sp. FL1284]|nr:hypothetical protein GGR52DRAFT_387547 [Hypoxylon sp. FL1284]
MALWGERPLTGTVDMPKENADGNPELRNSGDASNVDEEQPFVSSSREEVDGMSSTGNFHSAWRNSAARDWLRTTLRHFLNLSYPDNDAAYSQFQDVIVRGLPRTTQISRNAPPQPCLARFDVTWDPWTFHSNEEYEDDVHEVLARAITLTECDGRAQVSISLDYVLQTWPDSGPGMMRLLQNATSSTQGTLHTCRYTMCKV